MKFLILFLLAGLLPFFVCAQESAPAVTCQWKFKLPDSGTESSPALALDGTVYQGTFHGWLLAFTSEGKVKWKFKTGREIKSSPAVAPDGSVYFGSRDGKFYALTPQGKLKWTFTTGGWVDSSPSIAANGTLYFGSWDSNFYALTPDGAAKWKFATGGIVSASPAIGAEGTIYIGSHDRNFYALNPDGTLKWKFSTGAEIIASAAIGPDGAIFFPSTDGNFYALNPDGSERWRLHTGGFTASSPVMDENGDLFLSLNKFQGSISHDGKLRWQRGSDVPMNMSPAVGGNGQEYYSLPWLRIGALDRAGNNKWEFQLKGNNLQSSPNLDSQGIIYCSDGVSLFALVPATNAAPPAKSYWPMWRANPQHTGCVQK